MGAVLGSSSPSKGEAEQLDRLYNQTRDLRLIRLAASAYVDGIEVSDAEVEQFYKPTVLASWTTRRSRSTICCSMPRTLAEHQGHRAGCPVTTTSIGSVPASRAPSGGAS